MNEFCKDGLTSRRRMAFATLVVSLTIQCGVLLSSPAHAQQLYHKADGTTTTDKQAALDSWTTSAVFQFSPILGPVNAQYAYILGTRAYAGTASVRYTW